MRLVIRPVIDPQREIDLTHRLTAAIAEELWRLFGGNEQLNWAEAELHLQRLVAEVHLEAHGQARDEARHEADQARERLFAMMSMSRLECDATPTSESEQMSATPGRVERERQGIKGRGPRSRTGKEAVGAT